MSPSGEPAWLAERPAGSRSVAPAADPIGIVIQLLTAIVESRSPSAPGPGAATGPMLTVAQTAALLGISRTTVIRKADAGDLPCVVVSQGTRKKMRRFPLALVEDLALHAGGGEQTDLRQYAASWLASVSAQSRSAGE